MERESLTLRQRPWATYGNKPLLVTIFCLCLQKIVNFLAYLVKIVYSRFRLNAERLRLAQGKRAQNFIFLEVILKKVKMNEGFLKSSFNSTLRSISGVSGRPLRMSPNGKARIPIS